MAIVAGKSLTAAGLLVLLFVAYQLWGTNLAESRAQQALKRQLAHQLPPRPPSTQTGSASGRGPSAPPPSLPSSSATSPARLMPPATPAGGPVALLEIPRLGLDKAVVEGISVADLKRGPGHYPGTPLPGQPGNAAIAGHRTTYGAPFDRLDELSRGDPVLVTTSQGRYRYEVSGSQVVGPEDTSVISPTNDARLTLTTCTPKFSASRRLVVVAQLVGPASELSAESPASSSPKAAIPPSPVASKDASPPVAPSAASTSPNPAGGRRAARLAIAWGALCAAIALAAWLLAHRWRRWLVYLLAAPPFFAALFVFFEHLSRLLPPNV